MSKLCYFLAYRRTSGREKLRLSQPTGGLVMKPWAVVNGVPAADLALAADVLTERYHCKPDEELVIAEVFCKKEQKLARQLHRAWEEEMHEFLELMESA